MSTLERSPSSFSQTGAIEAWTPPENVTSNLSRRLEAVRQAKADMEFTADTSTDTAESMDTDSPLYDQLMAEQRGALEVPQTAESSVATSTSRLGDLLRRGASAIDTSAERWNDTKDIAKKKLRVFGRSALNAAVATGELAAGTGLLVAAKGQELAYRADDAVTRGAEAVTTMAKESYNTALDRSAEIAMAAGAKIDNGLDVVGAKLQDAKESFKERRIARKEAALNRRQARRDLWSQRWNSAKETTNTVLDRSAEIAMAAGAKIDNGLDVVGAKMVNTKEAADAKIERTKNSVRVTRAAGRAALDAYQATRRIHAEQNEL